ncbi:Ankyrin repeats (3 copies) [Corynebacterium mustelae]|uniref:Ankyrin repeats (3 copies) n=1 Tax=Corynebacterium mustelae TaxID=571915 RepID=A0A0G3H0N9_9CORY|nr:ankyrin repeat domain-containing protein [Corynebacterium mustelae]AKK06330.1 Ankyrin repeats (3 copies) [Corynebacterium mustelae]
MTELHYEFTGESKVVDGVTVHRIRALEKHYGGACFVAAGDLGGWVEEGVRIPSTSWVADEAVVTAHSDIRDNVLIGENAYVSGGPIGHSTIKGNARVDGWVEIWHSTIRGDATINEGAVCEYTTIGGNAYLNKYSDILVLQPTHETSCPVTVYRTTTGHEIHTYHGTCTAETFLETMDAWLRKTESEGEEYHRWFTLYLGWHRLICDYVKLWAASTSKETSSLLYSDDRDTIIRGLEQITFDTDFAAIEPAIWRLTRLDDADIQHALTKACIKFPHRDYLTNFLMDRIRDTNEEHFWTRYDAVWVALYGDISTFGYEDTFLELASGGACSDLAIAVLCKHECPAVIPLVEKNLKSGADPDLYNAIMGTTSPEFAHLRMNLISEELQQVFHRYSTHPSFISAGRLTSVDQLGSMDETLLNAAVNSQDKHSVEILLQHGADVNGPGEMGFTPLHNACLHGNVSIARVLLDHGAKVGPKNEFGYDALHYAREGSHDKKTAKALTELLKRP